MSINQPNLLKSINKNNLPHILEIGNMIIEIEYSNSNKTLNECLLNILKKKKQQ